MSAKTKFRVSVGELVAAACQPDSLSRGYSSRTRAQEGIQTHTLLQQNYPPEYQSEVGIRFTIERPEFDLEVFGRMDGFVQKEKSILIEEIKTTRKAPDLLCAVPEQAHLAQLKCYGYMAAIEHPGCTITLKLTYANAQNVAQDPSGAHASHEFTSTLAELESFFENLVAAYLRLLDSKAAWQKIRNPSLERLKFPFSDFRKGQRQMAEAVYKVIRHKKLLFARAPTGTGKTMAVLFPALKAMGENHVSKIFYLTAKTPGQHVAEKAVSLLSQAGARLKSVTLTAKQKTCFTPDIPCDMETCVFASQYYTKLARAMAHLKTRDAFDFEILQELGRRYEICPFELSLDLAMESDLIICDLNYAFDPRVYLKRFFDRNTKDLAFLMDEAHNLPDRLRSMYGAKIEKPDLLDAQDLLRDSVPRLAKDLVNIVKEMARLFTAHPGTFNALDQLPENFIKALDTFYDSADLWLDNHTDHPMREAVLERFYQVNSFLNISRFFGDNFRVFLESDKDTGHCIRLFCLDPSPVFSKLITRCQSAVFFSATFFPFAYYQHLLLGDVPQQQTSDRIQQPDLDMETPPLEHKEAGSKPQHQFLIPYTISLESPFARENFKLLIHQGIKTTFRHRAGYYRDIAGAIENMATARPGNYLVFFSSYQYMEQVLDHLDSDQLGIPIQVQEKSMDETQRKAFLDAFTRDSRMLGFAVMGGIFSEGIDLEQERLIGVIVVGVGLPQVCDEQNEIRSYYDSQGRDGFFFAYQMPGFNRVLQAAGRLLRTEQDRGIVLLMDERFARPDYQSLFPGEWQGPVYLSRPDQLHHEIKDFWQIEKKPAPG